MEMSCMNTKNRLFAGLMLVLFSCSLAVAQPRKLQYRPYIDQRRFHYGFLFGLNIQDMELRNNGYVNPETGAQWSTDTDHYT